MAAGIAAAALAGYSDMGLLGTALMRLSAQDLLPALAVVLLVFSVGACADSDPFGPEGGPAASLEPTPHASVRSLAGLETPIRIGVVPSASAVEVGATSEFTVREKSTGEVIVASGPGALRVSIASEGRAQTNFRLQAFFTRSAAFRDDWVTRATAQGYATFVQPFSDGWRLLIGEFARDASFSVRNAFRLEVIAKGLAGSDAFWRLITIVIEPPTMSVALGGAAQITPGPVVIEPSVGGFALIGGKRYRGTAEVAFNSSVRLAGINELPVEEYLYGVVPLELPPEPFPEVEAHKAQAIAARTFALANRGRRGTDGYDLLPTTADQVYGGFDAEHPISNRAVDGTRGVVATHDGRLISALFHSTSGGWTAHSEDIFVTALPYLRGVPDAERGRALEHVPTLEVFKNHSNPTSLRALREGDFESDWSRLHRWTFEWTQEEITRAVKSHFPTLQGPVLEIDVVERSSSGRVLEVRFVTPTATFVERKDRVRSALKFVDGQGNLRSLLSTLFFIEPVSDPRTKALLGFRAYGGGWGHGVGVSQTGAVGLAKRGRTFEDILKHYYRGIELETAY